MSSKILYLLTSTATIPSTDKATGWYLPEFAHPYYVLKNAGYGAVIVSPKGGEAPLDQGSVQMFKEDAECQKFLKEEEGLWKDTRKLSEFLGKASEFVALVIPGGHGRKYSAILYIHTSLSTRVFGIQGRALHLLSHFLFPTFVSTAN